MKHEPFLSYGTSYPFSERQTDLPIRKSLDTKINIKFVENLLGKVPKRKKLYKILIFIIHSFIQMIIFELR